MQVRNLSFVQYWTKLTVSHGSVTSSQWAAIAVLAEELHKALKEAAEERKKATLKKGDTKPVTQLIEPRDTRNERSTDAKIAEAFNTNREYVNQARKLKEEKQCFFLKF